MIPRSIPIPSFPGMVGSASYSIPTVIHQFLPSYLMRGFVYVTPSVGIRPCSARRIQFCFCRFFFSGIRKSFQLYMRMRKPDLYRILIKLWHGMFPALKAGISCEAFQKSLVCMTGVFDRLFCYIIRHPKETFRYFYHSPAAFLIPSCRRILLYWRTGIILSFVCYWGATSHCI